MYRMCVILAIFATLVALTSAQCSPLSNIDNYNQYELELCPLPSSSPATLTNITVPTFTSNDNGVNINQIFLPFPIQVYGVDWDRIWFNTNGALFFGSIGSTLGSATLPLTFVDAESLPVIAAAWADLFMETDGANPLLNSEIVHSTQGSAGDRQFIVRYSNMRYYETRADNNVLASFDVVFYENPARQGDVDMRYYRWDLQADFTSMPLTVGMQSFDQTTSYWSLYEDRKDANHSVFAQQVVGKQLSLRYIGEDSVNTSCGALGYNLTSIRGFDINFTDPGTGNLYFLNICGEVQNPMCADNAATEKAMMCMVPAGDNPTPVDLGIWGPSAVRYELPPGNSPGLNMVMQNGQQCRGIAGFDSQVYTRFQFTCDPTEPSARIVWVAGAPAPCVFVVIVLTELACHGAIPDNSTMYRASTMPGCTTTRTPSGYTSTLCPRSGHDLEPPALTDPVTHWGGNNGANEGVVQAELPFSFPFFGQLHNTVNISVKGALLFGDFPYTSNFTRGFPDFGMTLNEQGAFPAILGFGGDIISMSAGGIPFPQILHSVEVDSLRRRQFVVRYWDMKFQNTMGLLDSKVSFDIVLTEGGGIDIKYYVVVASNNRFSSGVRGLGANNYTAQFSDEQLTASVASQLRGTTMSFTIESSSQCASLSDVDHYQQYDLQLCTLAQPSPVILTNITVPVFTNEDDGISENQIFLPFPVQIYGVDYDRIWLNTNGAFFFGSVASFSAALTLPLTFNEAETLPVVAAAWTDLTMITDNVNPALSSRIEYSTQGQVGDRQFIVRYSNMRYWVSRDNSDVLASFDIVFYENPARQGDVDIRYYRWDLRDTFDNAGALTVGMQNWDQQSSYWSLYEDRKDANHSVFAQQVVGKQLSLRYIGEDSVNTSCGAFSYNFTSLRGTDLEWTDGAGNRYLMNMCGEIVNPVCANHAATEKAMICMVPPGDNPIPVDLGVFGPSAFEYELPREGPGLYMHMQNGGTCGLIGAQIVTHLMFMCDPEEPSGRFVASAQAPPPCVFYLTVVSSLACHGAVRDNSTSYRTSNLPSCVAVNGSSESSPSGTLCPRSSHNLDPPALNNPITVLNYVYEGLAKVSLPFSFPFYGQSYTHMNISVKGALLFGPREHLNDFSYPFPDLGSDGVTNAAFPVIVGFGGSLVSQTGPGVLPSPQISYSNEIDTNGRRQFVVRYQDMRFENTMGLIDSSASFDIVLSEDGAIDIKYYVVSPSNNKYSIGLRGPANTNTYTAVIDYIQLTAASAFNLRGTTLSFPPVPQHASSSSSTGAVPPSSSSVSSSAGVPTVPSTAAASSTTNVATSVQSSTANADVSSSSSGTSTPSVSSSTGLADIDSSSSSSLSGGAIAGITVAAIVFAALLAALGCYVFSKRPTKGATDLELEQAADDSHVESHTETEDQSAHGEVELTEV